ncbi:hypothetical protein G3O08_18625 [Cryomorpha ignava]|uniref:Glycoside hydrolase n=1 Tax=Cryomorpha ignava TaxID=101383 RepID=A0A7K3WWT0_9FLAO|nr:hypothetical protein [Cryomorpha ignava]NEN25511.1 hypothetical protein [Cryomorpha ignava]
MKAQIFLLGFIFIVCNTLCSHRNEERIRSDKINGMTLESPPKAIDSSKFDPLKDLNVNYVCIVPYAFSPKNNPSVVFNHKRQWWGEREEGVEELIKMARSRTMRVMLKPQVWMHQGWVGDFNLESPADWKLWEDAYRNYIVFYAEIAEANKVEIFCIGTEYKVVSSQRPDYWIGLIAEIRKIYSGELTYAANWDEYESISFWDKLDYIGINAYFPLSQKQNPERKELELVWQNISSRIELIHSKFQKPVLFTEFGYRSVDFAAGNQWELNGKTFNAELQEKAFRAFFNSPWKESWVAGGFIWKWEFEENAGGENNTKYTPQDKPALKAIREVYWAK